MGSFGLKDLQSIYASMACGHRCTKASHFLGLFPFFLVLQLGSPSLAVVADQCSIASRSSAPSGDLRLALTGEVYSKYGLSERQGRLTQILVRFGIFRFEVQAAAQAKFIDEAILRLDTYMQRIDWLLRHRSGHRELSHPEDLWIRRQLLQAGVEKILEELGPVNPQGIRKWLYSISRSRFLFKLLLPWRFLEVGDRRIATDIVDGILRDGLESQTRALDHVYRKSGQWFIDGYRKTLEGLKVVLAVGFILHSVGEAKEEVNQGRVEALMESADKYELFGKALLRELERRKRESSVQPRELGHE